MSESPGTEGVQRSIEWEAGRWTHPPAAVRLLPDGSLRATAVEGSDAWRITSYGFINDSEHALVVPFEPGTSMEVELDTAFSQQFDQAGLFVRASAEQWVKAGVEFADGVAQIGAVFTDGRSDWSAAPAPEWGAARVTFRVSWADDALTIRARRSDSDWQLVRLLPFDAREGVTAGPYLCAPSRPGLEVGFHAWRVGEPDRSLH